MNRRDASLVAGVLVAGLGGLAATNPGLVPVAGGEIVTQVAGALLLVQAVRVLRDVRRTDGDPLDLPATDRARSVPRPGDDIDETFEGAEVMLPDRKQVRERLESTARVALSREGVADDEARTLLADGTWTDDEIAARFLGEGGQSTSDRGFLGRLVSRGDEEPTFLDGIRHTVDALVARVGHETIEGPESDGVPRPPGGGTTPGAATPVRRATGRWNGVTAIGYGFLGAGAIAGRPSVVLAGLVGVGYAAYARLGGDRELPVSVERTVADERPDVGDEVAVTVTVRNEGDQFLPDVRLVDGVPGALTVDSGTARHATALRAGETASFRYAVTARRGAHAFDPALVVGRGLNDAVERRRLADAETTLVCTPPLGTTAAPLPLRTRAARYAGQLPADAGAGIEFHSTREYRRGDPFNRIDWGRYARTGVPSTVEFHEERAATAVVVVDARREAYLAPDGGPEHAVDRSVDAAGRIVEALLDAGNRVGVAAYGPRDCWLSPGAGADHHERIRTTLAIAPAFASTPPEEPSTALRWAREFHERFPAHAQVVFVSPICDYPPTFVARRLNVYGHPVAVVSPDPTVGHTPGQRLAAIERTFRLTDLRAHGLRAIDWKWDESLDAALRKAARRWDR